MDCEPTSSKNRERQDYYGNVGKLIKNTNDRLVISSTFFGKIILFLGHKISDITMIFCTWDTVYWKNRWFDGGGFRPIISLFGFRSLRNYEKIGVFKKMTFFSESDSWLCFETASLKTPNLNFDSMDFKNRVLSRNGPKNEFQSRIRSDVNVMKDF